jgi:hypothetical protein
MKIQINDEVRNATEEEISAIENAITEAQRLIEIENSKKENEAQAKILKVSAYQKLGLTNQEITAVIGLTEEEARLLLGGN